MFFKTNYNPPFLFSLNINFQLQNQRWIIGQMFDAFRVLAAANLLLGHRWIKEPGLIVPTHGVLATMHPKIKRVAAIINPAVLLKFLLFKAETFNGYSIKN